MVEAEGWRWRAEGVFALNALVLPLHYSPTIALASAMRWSQGSSYPVIVLCQ